MIAAGLRAVPWLRPTKTDPRGKLNCTDCLAGTSEPTRARMHCGFMPREKWHPDASGVPVFGGAVTSTCPGWLVRQAAVVDGAQAVSALESQALANYDPAMHEIVWEAASVGLAAANAHAVEEAGRP